MEYRAGDKRRSRSRSPPPWHKRSKAPRPDVEPRSRRDHDQHRKHNQLQADREAREWINKEDEFVLKQAKKKARIRVREGRAMPIDWLAVALSVVDVSSDVLEDDDSASDIELVDPVVLIEELDLSELRGLEKDVENYLALEPRGENRRFWKSMKLLCKDRITRLSPPPSAARGVGSISSDVARLLGPKTRHELDALEDQVRSKLRSRDDIDVEYWEHLLDQIRLYKSRSDLRRMYRSVLEGRLVKLKKEQLDEADKLRNRLESRLAFAAADTAHAVHEEPEPRLKLEANDRRLHQLSEEEFLSNTEADHQRAQEKGYIPKQDPFTDTVKPSVQAAAPVQSNSGEVSQSTNAMYDKEAAKGFEEDEEAFAAEEAVQTVERKSSDLGYRSRKPKYFNRVQLGYEWNKYNQTHYDQDNPPPKVVQGYKFNIFYPDLIDRSRAPTYRIERENGRRRGQSFAPAGSEDSCIIRFMSGPPYEDIAFRIVDKEWDYSARRERGFKSTFDKGILQLHFQFKKVHYRK